MAVITGYTATRMKEIEDTTIVSGSVNTIGNLILTTRVGAQIDAGAVMDPLQPGTVDQYYRGDKTWQALTKGAVLLGNVDNTSDANKPISTAQATKNAALDAEDAKLAKGIVYRQQVATTSGSIVDAICSNIPSFTFKANRHYRIIWDFSYYATGNSDSLFFCCIYLAPTEDAAASLANLTALDGRTKGLLTSYSLGSTQHTGPVTAHYSPGASDVTTQIKFRPVRVLGDDGIYIVGNGNERAMYTIEDLGTTVV